METSKINANYLRSLSNVNRILLMCQHQAMLGYSEISFDDSKAKVSEETIPRAVFNIFEGCHEKNNLSDLIDSLKSYHELDVKVTYSGKHDLKFVQKIVISWGKK